MEDVRRGRSARPSLRIVLRAPEITLKGRNQGAFRARLRANATHCLSRAGIGWPVRAHRGRVYVEVPDSDEERLERALAVLDELLGAHSSCVGRWLLRSRIDGRGPEHPLIEETVVQMAAAAYAPGLAFAVRVHRADKAFPLTSSALEARLGDAIRRRTPWERVCLDEPDRTFYIDVYSDGLLVYDDRRSGMAGLPVGTSSRVLSLLSGGIDSPVASFLLARRGCEVDLFHMSAVHFSENDFADSVIGRLARRLSRYTVRSRLFVIPYTHFDLALPARSTGFETVLFRRFLFRVADRLAASVGGVALVAGDSLAQVASQTVENLAATSKSVDRIVLRPLVGLDKQQIMDLAERIGTYEISIEPYKDCCALLSRRPRTKSYHEPLAALERRLFPDYDGLVKRSVDDLVWGAYDCGALVEVGKSLAAATARAGRWRAQIDAEIGRGRRSRARSRSSRGKDAA